MCPSGGAAFVDSLIRINKSSRLGRSRHDRSGGAARADDRGPARRRQEQKKGKPWSSSPLSRWPPWPQRLHSRGRRRRRSPAGHYSAAPGVRQLPRERSGTRSTSTAHGAKNDADGSMCQACHGNATEHLKDPTKAKPANPFGKGRTATSRRRSASTCHRATAISRSGPPASIAQERDHCSNCHSIHGKSLAPVDRQVRDDVPAEPGGHLRQLPPADPRGDASSRRTTRSSRAR